MNYEITGENLPVVICTLQKGETMITQAGGMSWMSPNMKMSTKMGGIGKGVSRKLLGESAFLNHYTAEGGTGLIAFASSFPGEIKPFEIYPGHEFILQKRSFLAGTDGINLSVWFQKKLSAGLWGGEGFIMQKVSGRGVCFAEFDGSVTEYELGRNDRIVMETGHLVAMSGTCKMDITMIPGAKNIVFGGEGLFNTTVTGPGRVWLQSIPLYKLAGVLAPTISNLISDK